MGMTKPIAPPASPSGLSRFLLRAGPISAAKFDPAQPLSLDIGETTADGSYQVTGTFSCRYAAGVLPIGTKEGMPCYMERLADGLFVLTLSKDGREIARKSWQTPQPASHEVRNHSVDLSCKFDDLSDDDTTGNVTLSLHFEKGDVKTGLVKRDDYYLDQISSDYYRLAVHSLRCKWTAW
jgi:hypothetical protein